MHLIKESKQQPYNEANVTFSISFHSVLRETPETTLYRCLARCGSKFASLKVNEDDLVHKVFSIAIAQPANINATEKKKDGL